MKLTFYNYDMSEISRYRDASSLLDRKKLNEISRQLNRRLKNGDTINEYLEAHFTKADVEGRAIYRIDKEAPLIGQMQELQFSFDMAQGYETGMSCLKMLHYVEWLNGLRNVKGRYPMNNQDIYQMCRTAVPHMDLFINSLMRTPLARITGLYADNPPEVNLLYDYEFSQTKFQIPYLDPILKTGLVNPKYNSSKAFGQVMKFAEESLIESFRPYIELNHTVTTEVLNEQLLGMNIVWKRFNNLTLPIIQ